MRIMQIMAALLLVSSLAAPTAANHEALVSMIVGAVPPPAVRST